MTNTKTPPRIIWRGPVTLRLADALGITVDRCHVGEFDVATCRQALAAIKRGEVRV